ncbi:hypothetical protein AN219_06495 [Streptomyces nanshensis]|nr:hypothetical protein AN219_06495 [Streptomyces nanshensis]
MGLFNRKSSESTTTRDTASYELGRDYAIARRHRDRGAQRQIARKLERDDSIDSKSFGKGRQDYEAIPPVSTPRRGRRR